MSAPRVSPSESRRFACTACGKCCDRGPEMELGEATALADRFITRALFKLHSLPLPNHGQRIVLWSKGWGSVLPARKALDEAGEHLGRFSAWHAVDRAKGRALYLTISALSVDREPGRCAALIDNWCSFYAERPVSCRTVPLHYSRPPSTLAAYLDSFVGTPGYRCETGAVAPMVLAGGGVADAAVEQARRDAIRLAEADRAWKAAVVERMRTPGAAAAAGLPSHELVVCNSDAGCASLVSMLVLWRIARDLGILSPAAFDQTCRRQRDLLAAAIGNTPDPDRSDSLKAMMAEYELEAADSRRSALSGAPSARVGARPATAHVLRRP